MTDILRPRGVPRGTVTGALATIKKQISKFCGNSSHAGSPALDLGQESLALSQQFRVIPLRAESPVAPSRRRYDGAPLSAVDPPWQGSETAKRLEAHGWNIVRAQIVNATQVRRFS